MIIRATQKILTLSGIKPVKILQQAAAELPGEWYVNLLSLGRPGKTVLHFLHRPTMISILVPGKSLRKAIPVMRERVSDLLTRNGFGQLAFAYQLQTEVEIYTTDSRSMLAFMNQMKYGIEHHLMMAETPEKINYKEIEDIQLDYLFTKGGKAGKYERSKDILSRLLKSQEK